MIKKHKGKYISILLLICLFFCSCSEAKCIKKTVIEEELSHFTQALNTENSISINIVEGKEYSEIGYDTVNRNYFFRGQAALFYIQGSNSPTIEWKSTNMGHKLFGYRTSSGLIAACADGYGLFDHVTGEALSKRLWTYMLPLNGDEKRFIICENQKYGLMDKDGAVIVEPVYDFIGNSSENLILAVLNEKYGYIDASGKTVIPFQLELPSNYLDCEKDSSTDKSPYAEEIRYQEKYNSIYEIHAIPSSIINPYKGIISLDFQCGKAITSNGSVIDTQGNTLTATDPKKAFIRLLKNGFYYEHSLNMKLDDTEPVSEFSYPSVLINSIVRIYNTDAQCIFSDNYEFVYGIEALTDDRVKILSEKGMCVLAADGTTTFFPEEKYWGEFINGIAIYRASNGLLGYRTMEAAITPPKWKKAYDFQEGKGVIVDETGQLGFVKPNGNIITTNYLAIEKEVYHYSEEPYGFSEGLLEFEDVEGKQGYMNEDGKCVIAPIWDTVNPFFQGRAIVIKQTENHKIWALIDNNGQILAEYDFILDADIEKGYLYVEKNNRNGVIDLDGTEIIPAEYADICYCGNDTFYATRTDGDTVVNCWLQLVQ